MVLLLSLVTSKTHHALSLRERFAAIVSNFTTSLSAAPSDSPCHHGARRRMVINSSTATLTDGDEKKKSPLLCHHDHDNETNKSDQSSKFFCGICLDDKPVSDMFKVGKCEHSFCTHGISKHVATQMHQNILVVMCPNPKCSMELKPEYLHAILPREVLVRWKCAMFESLIVESEKTYYYCPFKDCSVLLVKNGGEVVTGAECPSCHRLFCAQCKVPWHEKMSCNEFQELQRKIKKLDEMSPVHELDVNTLFASYVEHFHGF
ncbi:hypothetical protein JHK82_049547 [Glycine max]|uniref:RBR-type E3 ubiquitin transferase n=1 Tax=Glycine max TaxID=3847 RepID=A0A0R0F6H3_SOYBN|nr:hypothetical protein JHK86_049407 [Glycine max]KAG4935251.1 hypothetical protein JHK85_050170 [Glycine max]KAG5090769.1 hypothetical protein JHK82_049547 [Glycine max]KAH1153489.1 hypothetical protein GYH30_049223 [Glycine max]KAH1197040.1 E3 ubiquitin-protein ligase [Glycine max]